MKKLLSILIMFLFVGTAFGQTIPPGAIDANMNIMVSTYNSNIDQIPSFVKAVIGNENLHIYFTLSNGQVLEYAAITDNGLIKEAAKWTDTDGDKVHDSWKAKGINPTMALRADETTALSIANSPDPLIAFKQAWGSKIKFEAIDWGAHFKIFGMNLGMWFAGFFMPPAAPQASAALTNQKAGAICQDGGECASGYCLYYSGQGAQRTYKCSCDQLTLTIQDPCPVNPYQPAQGTGKAVGETCNHGGECTTGNCVGTGQGPPWVYKCSCDPFTYDAYSC